jgi:ATP-dependent DNA helicase RecG
VTPAADPCTLLAGHALPVEKARFVDSARAAALRKTGIETIGDLLRHFPARYLDLTRVATLAEVRIGCESTVIGRVHEIKIKKPRPRMTITEVAIVDGTGVLLGVWFNQPYIERRFAIGETVAFAGKVELDFGLKQIKSPFVEKLSADDGRDLRVTGHVLPVHRTTEGLSTNWLRRLITADIDDYSAVPDHLPAELRERRALMPLSVALRSMHFPSSLEQAAEARRRLAYDEVLALQLYMALRRHALAHPMSLAEDNVIRAIQSAHALDTAK